MTRIPLKKKTASRRGGEKVPVPYSLPYSTEVKKKKKKNKSSRKKKGSPP